MGTKIGCAAVLLGVMCIVASVAANENAAGVAEKRGLSPIISTGATPQPDYILKYCSETESGGDPRSAMRGVDPAGMLWIYLQNRDKHAIDLANIKNITLLEGTKHGEITAGVDNTGLTSYHYNPEPEYVGNDRAAFMVEYQWVRYKIVVDLHVFSIVMENMPSSCPPPKLIKVNKPAKGATTNRTNRGQTTFYVLHAVDGRVE